MGSKLLQQGSVGIYELAATTVTMHERNQGELYSFWRLWIVNNCIFTIALEETTNCYINPVCFVGTLHRDRSFFQKRIG